MREGGAGAPVRSLPNTGEVLHVGFWGPIGFDCHYVYVKFDIPTHLADKEILSATFHAYNIGWMSEHHCGTIFSYIENDNWTRETPDPFPMYREPRVFSQSQFAEEGQWYALDIAPYLFMPGEGPGSALTLQMEQTGPGNRGLRIPGPTHEDPALRPYLEITYGDVPVAGPRILIADDSNAFVWNAARVLKEYIAQTTSQALPIISVDKTDELPAAAIIVDGGWLAAKAGVDVSAEHLKYDGFIVRNVKGRLILTGAAERGVLYAVMDFLEDDLGCRWYSPKREVIPTGKRLLLNVPTRREEPAFEVRWPTARPTALWQAANRTTNTLGVWGQDPMASNNDPHSIYNIAPPSKYFQEHPDWYSYQNGIWFTNGGQFNCHSADLAKLVSDSVVKALTDNPQWRNFWVSQRDCLGWSQDPVTNAFDGEEGSTTASLVHFVNQVAEAVAQTHPERRVFTLAYHQSLTPPKSLRYAPNVVAFICTPWTLCNGGTITRSGPIGQHYLNMVRDWAGKCDHPYAWTYHMEGVTSLGAETAALQAEYQALRKAGIQGVFSEIYGDPDGSDPAPYYHLRLYMLTKLWWNPDLDMNALLQDFHEGYYGRAAGRKMLEYYRVLSADPKTYGSTEQWLDELQRILDEARLRARDDFSRRMIDIAKRAVLANKLSRLTSAWEVRDGYVQNHVEAPATQALFPQLEAVTQAIGDDQTFTSDQFAFKEQVVVLNNGDLELLVTPERGGQITRIRDLKTGMEFGRASLRKTWLGLPPHQNYPFASAPLAVGTADARKVVMAADWSGRRVRKTIKLAPSGLSFRVSSSMSQSGPEPSSDAIITRISLSAGGEVSDCYMVWRDGEGQMHSELMRNPWETRSSGWGPTGLLAVVNPKTNTGFVWELSTVHNGGWYRIELRDTGYAPYEDKFEFDLYGERARTGSGETARHLETFTFLRDARRWCERHGVRLPQ